MGFYLRKSVSVGPLRFNLSKSGIGVSAGVRGLRFGTGPRGNYVHMGRSGLYYRATVPSSSGPAVSPRPVESGPASDNLTPIDSAPVEQMVDASSSDLLQEIAAKRKRWRTWPWVCVAFFFMAGALPNAATPASNTDSVIAVAFFVTWAMCTWLAYRYDTLSKTVVLLYDIEDDASARYQRLHDAFAEMMKCQGQWHIGAEGAVSDRKRNAGASSLVRRSRVSLTTNAPKWIQTNIAVPAVPVGTQTLHLFPDRVLVLTKDGAGAVSYPDLQIVVRSTRFIESETVPQDARVVDQTWKYVNKNGGPDKRFKDNRQLPITLYEELALTSPTGLNEVIQLSRVGTGQTLVDAAIALGRVAAPAATST
jgi:hypothetical protein